MENRWLWPFELKEKIGQGGMGVVYRARYVKNDREVAVKLLPPEIVGDHKVRTRFERELEALKSLKHPHIVYCFGGKCEGEQFFYAMELVEGGSLETLLRKRGRLPWEQVAEYAVQLCSALHFAHEHGIVHRDIKPGNLLLTRMGKLKLSDFGLARARSESRLTDHGKTMGTFQYMAPEQIRGAPELSGQTDLYAMGCVLFEMLAGRTPFQGNSAAEILQKHLEKQPPPVSTNAMDCPAAFEDLIMRLLEKKPAKRPTTAMDVAREIKQIAKGRSLDATTRDLTVRNTKAAQAVQDATTGDRRARRRAPGDTNWLAISLVVCIMVIAGLLAWNRAMVSNRSSSDQAIGLWVAAAADPNPVMRMRAIKAIEELGEDAASGVDILITNLKDESVEIRLAAIKALSNIGPDASEAINELASMKKGAEDPRIRAESDKAIEAIRKARDNDDRISPWIYYVGAALVSLAAIGALFVRRIAKKMNT